VDGFIRVAASAAIEPGSERVLSVLGRKILLRRDAASALQALELACRHQNGDLSTATRDGDVVVCPRHGWIYDLRTGACQNEPWAELRRFAVREEEGSVWLSIQPATGD
jgi:nitrite reductase/ring-hydroxylating ferredoxin subunit